MNPLQEGRVNLDLESCPSIMDTESESSVLSYLTRTKNFAILDFAAKCLFCVEYSLLVLLSIPSMNTKIFQNRKSLLKIAEGKIAPGH